MKLLDDTRRSLEDALTMTTQDRRGAERAHEEFEITHALGDESPPQRAESPARTSDLSNGFAAVE